MYDAKFSDVVQAVPCMLLIRQTLDGGMDFSQRQWMLKGCAWRSTPAEVNYRAVSDLGRRSDFRLISSSPA
jgi:hypothetical protein